MNAILKDEPTNKLMILKYTNQKNRKYECETTQESEKGKHTRKNTNEWKSLNQMTSDYKTLTQTLPIFVHLE